MTENDQLVFEENVLLTEISRSELERSVLDLFPETCAGLSAGNRAQSLFETSRETVQVLPSHKDKTSPLTGDNVATVGQTPKLVAQKLQACKAPDNVISDQSRDDINHVPSPLFTASYVMVPQNLRATNLPDYVGRSNVEPVHFTGGDIDVPSRVGNYDWAAGPHQRIVPHSQTLASRSSYPRRYRTRLDVDSLSRQPATQHMPDERPLFTACRPVHKAGNREANYGQWVSRRQPESGPVNNPWGRRQDDTIDNTAGHEVSPYPGVRFSRPQIRSAHQIQRVPRCMIARVVVVIILFSSKWYRTYTGGTKTLVRWSWLRVYVARHRVF